MKNRLKVLRAENNWTQADLADHIGVARQTIIALESNKYSPSLTLAFKFSKLFNLPIEQIFTPEEIDFQ
jgi:putative transcriptional regulator